LYKHYQFQGLFDVHKGIEGIPPYLLSDKGYPLIDYMMTPFKDDGHHMIFLNWYTIKKHTRTWFLIKKCPWNFKTKFRRIDEKIKSSNTFLI